MYRGFVPIYRKLKDHWIYKDDKKLLAWIKILMEVNHTSKPILIKNVLFDCEKGESLKSLDSWVVIFGKDWNKTSVRRFFKLLETDNMIRLKSETVTTRLTVCNYESYNENRNADETQMKRKRNASETQVTPNNNVNNENNENNVNNKIAKKRKFIPDISKLQPDKIELINEWFEYKKERKEMYKAQSGVTKLINEMNKNSISDIQIAIDEAIKNQYKGFFVKTSNKQKQDLRTSEGLNANYSSGI